MNEELNTITNIIITHHPKHDFQDMHSFAEPDQAFMPYRLVVLKQIVIVNLFD